MVIVIVQYRSNTSSGNTITSTSTNSTSISGSGRRNNYLSSNCGSRGGRPKESGSASFICLDLCQLSVFMLKHNL